MSGDDVGTEIVNLANWEVHLPGGNPSAAMVIQGFDPQSEAGALVFVKHFPGGSKIVAHVFSAIGYTRCTLGTNGWVVLPTFDPGRNTTVIKATTVEVDDDGTAKFINVDSSGSKWPVAFISRDAYVYVRYDGPA